MKILRIHDNSIRGPRNFFLEAEIYYCSGGFFSLFEDRIVHFWRLIPVGGIHHLVADF